MVIYRTQYLFSIVVQLLKSVDVTHVLNVDTSS